MRVKPLKLSLNLFFLTAGNKEFNLSLLNNILDLLRANGVKKDEKIR